MATFNRLSGLTRAVNSVLDQAHPSFELIIVNDGSSDGTSEYLAGLDDQRVRIVERANGGLSAARNSGIAEARGEWMVFLDDDDYPLPRWLLGFDELIADSVGIVCSAAQYYTPDGEEDFLALPWNLGEEFDGLVASSLAGAFAVRTDLVKAVGGFEERMTCSHQTELWLRLVPEIERRGLGVHTTEEPLVALELRPPHQRPMSDPLANLQGSRVLLDKHREIYDRSPTARADLYGVIGVSHARMHQWHDARSALWAAVRSDPKRWQRWVRFAAASLPPVGRRIWRTAEFRQSH